MNEKLPNRAGFRDWIDKQSDPGWDLMPLTHITRGVLAEDIVNSGRMEPTKCKTLNKSLLYCFYGRPAYRAVGDKVITQEYLCPFCFVLSPNLLKRARESHAFDTGAFGKRLYSHVLAEDFNIGDFSLGSETDRPNKLIAATFRTKAAYFHGDTTALPPVNTISEPWEFLTRGYLELITSPGRNEPDDRVYTIEVNFADPVDLEGVLLAIVVPHTVWGAVKCAPWLEKISSKGVEIITYPFYPNRPPEYYQSHVEAGVQKFYEARGII